MNDEIASMGPPLNIDAVANGAALLAPLNIDAVANGAALLAPLNIDAVANEFREASPAALLGAGARIVAQLVYGPAPDDRDWLMLRAGLWTGEVLRREGTIPAPAPRRAAAIAVGTRFYSEGLRAPCKVLAVDGHELEFEIEGSEPVRTTVPLELAASHFRSGRWRLLERAP